MLDLGDKSATKSLTILGAAIFAAVQTAESLGAVPAGVAVQVAAAVKAVAGLLSIFGLRRAVANPVVVTADPEDFELETDPD